MFQKETCLEAFRTLFKDIFIIFNRIQNSAELFILIKGSYK